ncbi:hypothetical protein TUM4438_40380 [Shewanella sairae]|uniref:Type II secretion system protein GspF domain-containing protein n=1 Tax=Shewanella sairae TaxID=190310 RepID=A0ABQ4PQB5_9GAMM|nr:hypothetical protein [Shewanella sairae]MCL1132242.1 hypothetical protein [Shewanella sairae]GIU51288.1 hypothetical protein TUM4438_40380 [Shewanella sairae]
MGWQFSHKKQLKLLDNIHRLTAAGLKQRDIAEQIATYGSTIEKRIATELLTSIDSGHGFAEGLKNWIDRLSWQALIAGEQAGDLESGLYNALLTLRTRSASTSVLAKALAKPVLGVSLILAASAGLASGLFPKFASMVPMNRWDSLTVYAYEFGLFWQQWGVMLGTFVAISLIAVSISLPLLTGKMRSAINNWPIYRQYRLIQTSALLYSLGNLTTAKYGLLDSLSNIKQHASPFLTWHINKMISHVHQGRVNLGDILDTGLLNPSEQSTLKLLGQIGNNADILLRSAAIHHAIITDEVDALKSIGTDAIKILGALIGALMGAGVGMLVLNMATNIVI